MSLLWKKYTIEFSLHTKDNKQFRYVYVDFEQKRNWYWLIYENMAFHRCIKDCIQEWFLSMVNQAWIFEGENPFRLIDEDKRKEERKARRKEFFDKLFRRGGKR